MPIKKDENGRIVEEKTQPVGIGKGRRRDEATRSVGGQTLFSSSPTETGPSVASNDSLDDKTRVIGGAEVGNFGDQKTIRPESKAETTSKTSGSPIPKPAISDGRTKVFRPGSEDVEPAKEAEDPVVGWLVVEMGSGRGFSVPLGNGMNSVGRGTDQRVQLAFGDQTISSEKHFFVSYDLRNRKFGIHRGDSANLVYLNGQPVYGSEPLENFDQIEVGATTLRFVSLCGEHFDW